MKLTDKIEDSKLTLEDAIPCSVCGAIPKLQGGNRSGRIVCPNYRNERWSKIQHGNLSVDTVGITMGFSHWCYLFWTKAQGENEGIPVIVKDWNYIQSHHIDRNGFNEIAKGNIWSNTEYKDG